MEIIRTFLEASVGVLKILAIWLLITVAVVLIVMLSTSRTRRKDTGERK